MNIFENLIKVDESGNIVYNLWFEWDHFNIPNNPPILRSVMRKLMAFFNHCLKCTALDGCYLLESKSPPQPLHENCDCSKVRISQTKVENKAQTSCSIDKISNYIFNSENNKGKKDLFESWGYSIADSVEIQNELKNQALNNYINGNYELRNLDQYGLRLAIPVNLRGNKFYSGWMLEPEGKIRNITPFGGQINERK